MIEKAKGKLDNFNTPEAKAKRAASLKASWTPERREAFGKRMSEARSKKSKSAGSPSEVQNPELPGAKGDVSPSGEKPVDTLRQERPKSEAAEIAKLTEAREASQVRVGSAYKPTGTPLPPPGSGPATAPPKAGLKEKLWKPSDPSPEEFTNLTNAFSRLISKGYAGLAEIREYPGWIHTEDDMEPYKVIIRFALRRIKFDPGLLLVVLAIIEILEQEGTRLSGDLKMHKAMADAKKAAESTKPVTQ